MAKRFTDTDKWKKTFIKSLPTEYKLLYLFILDECDHAGIWHVEIELAELRLGLKFSLDKAEELLKCRIISFDGGSKWFLPDFIKFQYGELNSKNRAHQSVINRLGKYNLLFVNKPLISPLQGAMDKDKEKDSLLEDTDTTDARGIEFDPDHIPLPNQTTLKAVQESQYRMGNTNISMDIIKSYWKVWLVAEYGNGKNADDVDGIHRHFSRYCNKSPIKHSSKKDANGRTKLVL